MFHRILCLLVVFSCCHLVRADDSGRSPKEVSQRLLAHYGHSLDGNSYIQALAVIGRLQASQQWNRPELLSEVRAIIAPYASGKRKPQLQSSAQLAGHLAFAEFAKTQSADEREPCVALVETAAKRLLQPESPYPLKPMAANEMSDAVFMCGPILCAAGSLTGEDYYFTAAVDCIRSMRKMCLRDDGLYRHWAQCDAAWGRGNGFPAIGIVRCLEQLPAEHPNRDELLLAYRQHMAALLRFQDDDGAWHQVIDEPESYAEMTCTCMIGWAMERGMKNGWLPEAGYKDAAARAWNYASDHVGPAAEIDGACEGTGRQSSLQAYLDRKATRGRDDRGGAMALLFAIEVSR